MTRWHATMLTLALAAVCAAPVSGAQARQHLLDQPHAGTAHDVTDEK